MSIIRKVRIIDPDGLDVADEGSHPLHVNAVDHHGHGQRIDFVGKQWMVEPVRVIGATFIGTTIDSNFWTAASANGGGNTQANSLLTLASGAAANGRATVRSTKVPRFIFFNPMMWRAALRIPDTTVAHNTRRWGAFTDATGAPTDGFYFELDGAGALTVNCRNNGGTPTSIGDGNFNGAYGDSYTLDSNVHAFEIQYFVMRIEFLVDGKVLHEFTPTTANLSGVYSLPSNFVTLNDGTGGGDGTIEVWAANTLRLGPPETLPRSTFSTGTQAGLVLKRGAGNLHQLVISNISNGAAITLYDNTAASGTVLWASGTLPNNTTPMNIDLHQIPFETGLTLVVASAASDVLVVYE